MPELPDVTVYVERIAERTEGTRLEKVRLASPFVLRTAVPPISAANGKNVLVAAMTRENHTLKRALTDPTILSGIGNAYSDEILHRAKLSPMKQSSQMNAAEWKTLRDATLAILKEWTDRLREESKTEFPSNVTAFREGMAVHGRYGKPCPVCGSPVQRIIYADNETNYCAKCQTGGKLLADRSLSRLLKEDWPRTLEEMEEKRPAVQRSPNPARSTRTPKTR